MNGPTAEPPLTPLELHHLSSNAACRRAMELGYVTDPIEYWATLHAYRREHSHTMNRRRGRNTR